MRKFKIALIFFIGVYFFSSIVLACAPEFGYGQYLVHGAKKGFMSMPEGHFLFELERITGKKHKSKDPNYSEKSKENTADADVLDLEEALSELNISDDKKEQILSSYADARSQILFYLKNYPVENKFLWFGGRFRHYERIKDIDTRPRFSIELSNINVPLEFSLYLRGAVFYHNNDFKEAIKIWKALLNLPEGNRLYKSTWACFMIGKSYLSMRNQKEAIKYFELTRKYKEQGYKDSLNLTEESYGWQALAEYELGDYASSINHYSEILDINSLNKVCSRTLEQNENIIIKVIKNETAREVLASWLVSHWWESFYYGRAEATEITKAQVFLDAIEQANIKGEIKNADRIAWLYYNIGDFKNTKRWLDLSNYKTALSQWIDIKLLLRGGDIEGAINKLHNIISLFEKNNEWNVFYEGGKDFVLDNIYESIGVLRLSRQEYLMAFDVLLKSNYWKDIAYLAENVLTTEELESVLGQYKGITLRNNDFLGYSRRLEDKTLYSSLLYLTARRFARIGDWNKAIEYMPNNFRRWSYSKDGYGIEYENINLKELLIDLKTYLESSRDITLSKKERALNYYKAGLLMRRYGMELVGTELEPDCFIENGQYDISVLASRFAIITDYRDKHYYDADYWDDDVREINQLREKITKERDFFYGTEDEERRVLESMPKPLRRFHYRYIAADLMWEASKLLSDNDPIKVKALHAGGTYLKVKYPEEANKFYRELVLSCPDTEIGKKAKELRWFPKDIEIDYSIIDNNKIL